MRLSVVVTCTQPWPEVRACLDRLAPQARADEIEILVVDGSGAGLAPASARTVRWLPAPGLGPHELRLLGLGEARGDVVAITEDHCEVAPDWCERVLAAHASRPDAVAIAGPVSNGAESGLIDRASFFLVHARNLPDQPGRPDDWFPPAGSNVSYKREQIMRLVERPGDLELIVTPQLWAQGSLVLDERVVVAHSQSLGVAEHVINHFHSGRAHAGLASRCGMNRRALVHDAIAFPRRLLGATLGVGRDSPRHGSEIRRALPAMTILSIVAASGYLTGIAGPGRSLRRLR